MSDGETPTTPPSEVPLQEQTDIPSSAPEPSPSEACSILLAQAKQAFQERRRKDCLVLTRVILAIDADNKEAQVIENWIRADLQKDIEDVRSKILKSRQDPDSEMVQRAERMLRTILAVDPHNGPANLLLQEVRAAASKLVTPAPAPVSEMAPLTSESAEPTFPAAGEEYPGYRPQPSKWRPLHAALILVAVLLIGAFALRKYNARSATPAAEETAQSADTSAGVLDIAFNGGVRVYINDEYQGTTPMKPLRLAPKVYHLKYEQDGKEIGREDVTITAGSTTTNTIKEASGKLVFIVVPAAGVLLKIDGKPYGMTPESADVTPGIHQLEFSAVGYAPATVTTAVEAGKRAMVPILLKSLTASSGNKPNELPPPPPAGDPRANAAGVSTGTLKLTSPGIDVAIYEDDKPLGTTPVVLELKAGPHTLEYRHEGLKKTSVYIVQAGATATLTVTFEIFVQINVTPFAEVFIAGNPNVDLGETPLNNVSVPVGGTLIFKYRNFPDKTHLVTAKDHAISLSFP